jgi:hypothetical protein
MRAPFVFLLILLPLALWSCGDSKDTVTGGGTALVPTRIDLVRGFYGREVVLYIDHLQIFSVHEMLPSPIAGPEASFLTALETGAHLISVWMNATGAGAFQDSVRVSIGEAERYYIALDMVGGDGGSEMKLRAAVQTRPFGYQ